MITIEFKELLRKYNFSQSKLARISNVSQSNISEYCNKRSRLEASNQLTRLKLSRAFNMTLGEFEDLLRLKEAKTLAHNKQSDNNYTIVEL